MQLSPTETFWIVWATYWVIGFTVFWCMADESDSEGERCFLVFAGTFWPLMLFAYLLLLPFTLANKVKRRRN